MSDDQMDAFTWRVLHHIVRIIGCDISYNSLYEIRRTFDMYKAKEWWKENFDAMVMWSDIMIQTRQPPLCHNYTFHTLGEALEAGKKFHAARTVSQRVCTQAQ